MQPYEEGDIEKLDALGFRADDEEECQIATGMCCAENSHLAVTLTDAETFTIVREGVPVGIFGVAPIVSEGWPFGWAMPWFLASEELYTIKRDFLRQCPLWINHVSRHHPNLINWIYPKNKPGMKWAKFLGFEFVTLEPYGITGEHEFWRAVRSRP